MRETGFGLGTKVAVVAGALGLATWAAWAAGTEKGSSGSASSGAAQQNSDKSKAKSGDKSASGARQNNDKAGARNDKQMAMAGSGVLSTPPSELDNNFKILEGTWRCDARVPAGVTGPNAPEQNYKSTVKIKKDLNGFWYVGEYDSKKTKTLPQMESQFYLGYNPSTRQTTMTTFDSIGGMVQTTGPGMQGDSMVFTGEGMSGGGQKIKVRETITKTGDRQIQHGVEVDSGKGFQSVLEETCRK